MENTPTSTTWRQESIGGINFIYDWKATFFQPTSGIDNFKAWLKSVCLNTRPLPDTNSENKKRDGGFHIQTARASLVILMPNSEEHKCHQRCLMRKIWSGYTKSSDSKITLLLPFTSDNLRLVVWYLNASPRLTAQLRRFYNVWAKLILKDPSSSLFACIRSICKWWNRCSSTIRDVHYKLWK
jgi:hypothetical protein